MTASQAEVQMSIKPSVAVITRTKDRALLLERAMRSVLQQSFANWHHIIVNDGGDPAAIDQLVLRYRSQYCGRLSVIHNELSLAMESASNTGLGLADSEYFCIHDDDDSWEPTFLSEMTNYLNVHGQDKNVGGAICFANVIMEELTDDKIVEKSRHFFSDYKGLSYFSMLGRNWFPPICFMVRSAALKKIGAFDGRLPVLGDWDFNMRLMRHYDLRIFPKPLANYHHRNGGTFSNSVYAESDKHRHFRDVLLDRTVKQSLDAGLLDEGTLAILAMLTEKISQLEEKVERATRDLSWEVRNHVNWALGKEPLK